MADGNMCFEKEKSGIRKTEGDGNTECGTGLLGMVNESLLRRHFHKNLRKECLGSGAGKPTFQSGNWRSKALRLEHTWDSERPAWLKPSE